MPEQNLENPTVSLHYVEPDRSIRLDVARVAQGIGCHCEPYADFFEIAAHPPRKGIIIIRDDIAFGGIRESLERLLNLGVWLPVVAIDYKPTSSRVVQAVKDGALDYLTLPLKPMRLAACISRIMPEATVVAQKRMLTLSARQRLSKLSGREMQVLEALALGNSNKEIARALEISPRTVEIHRANLMSKLGAKHAVEAVRMKIDAHL